MERLRIDPGFIPEARIEQAAYDLISRYISRYHLGPEEPIPVEAILESLLSLTLEFEDLNASYGLNDVLGATWIGEETVRVDESLDPSLYPSKNGRYLYTISHEIGHWQLHRHFFVRDANQVKILIDESEPSILCRSSQKKEPMEYQADQFASYLLMPKDRVYTAWKGLRGSLMPYLAKQELRDLKNMWGDKFPVVAISKEMADKLNVSGQAMQIRLMKLGLIRTEPPEPDLFSMGQV